MKYRIINDFNSIDLEQWRHLLKNSKYANVFQSPKMYMLWQSIDGTEPFIFACIDEHDKIKVLLTGLIQKESGKVKGILTKRAIVLGGPLLAEECPTMKYYISKTLETASKQLKKKAIFIEIRNLNDYSEYKSIFEENKWTYNPHLNFMVNCQNEDNIRKNMSKSKIRQIKKSLKEGAEIIEATNEQQVTEFYYILQDLYTKKVKKPLMPIEFFLLFFRQKLGKYLLIKYRDRIVGGIMCPILNNRAIYCWYTVGEDRLHNNIHPSVLATWAAIEYANKHNIEIFDFMGAGKPDQDYGVRNFKSKFGGDLVEHGRFIKILNPVLFKLGKLGLMIYRKVK